MLIPKLQVDILQEDHFIHSLVRSIGTRSDQRWVTLTRVEQRLLELGSVAAHWGRHWVHLQLVMHGEIIQNEVPDQHCVSSHHQQAWLWLFLRRSAHLTLFGSLGGRSLNSGIASNKDLNSVLTVTFSLYFASLRALQHRQVQISVQTLFHLQWGPLLPKHRVHNIKRLCLHFRLQFSEHLLILARFKVESWLLNSGWLDWQLDLGRLSESQCRLLLYPFYLRCVLNVLQFLQWLLYEYWLNHVFFFLLLLLGLVLY